MPAKRARIASEPRIASHRAQSTMVRTVIAKANRIQLRCAMYAAPGPPGVNMDWLSRQPLNRIKTIAGQSTAAVGGAGNASALARDGMLAPFLPSQ